MRNHMWKMSVVVSLLMIGFVAPAWSADTDWIEGTLLIAWGTPNTVLDESSAIAASLSRDDGSIIHLEFDQGLLAAAGGIMKAGERRVRVQLPADSDGAGRIPVRPLAIKAADQGAASPDLASGSYPYVSLMCQFQGNTSNLASVGYFQGMYANVWPGLDHYWRRQSYGMVNVVGSTAAGWFMLPHTQAYYEGLISGSNYSTMLSALYNDCTNAASGTVNVNNYEGVNLMFNDTFGPYAWGGWGGVTWEPPWGWGNVAVICHEMGHAFGLPHSNNADNDGSPYDNPWDIMSDSWGYADNDTTYGRVGKHTISYHKDSLGWIPAARKAVVSTSGIHEFDIDHLTYAGTSNFHMVKVEIPGSSRYYTIEVRDLVGYDDHLPGFAVVIHEVDNYRQEPAWLVDVDNLSNGADAGAMWLPDECFDDAANEISICVLSITTEGYRVRVSYGEVDLVFMDGFESGSEFEWSFLVQ